MSISQQSLEQAATTSSFYTWKKVDLPWRIEAEIDIERQVYLAERCAGTVDIGQGIYPFKDIKLSRADIEWLLAKHEDRRGPEDWSDESQRTRLGLDLRGADLRQMNLRALPLARMLGGRNWTVQFPSTDEQLDMARVHLEGADLGGAHLEEAYLGGAHLEEAYLSGAHLEGASLVGASLVGASLKGKPVPADYLKRVRQWDKDVLPPANLQGAFFDSKTVLEDVILGEEKYGFVSLADIHWGDVNLSVVDWEAVTMLGDERRALQTTWLYNYQGAVRAYRQLATVLRAQGLNEEAVHFAYRAEVLQRRVIWRQMLQLRREGRKGLPRLIQKMMNYLLSWLLDLFAGYGYKPIRSLISYLLVIIGFMLVYCALGMVYGPLPSWSELLALSVAAFHGWVFLPNQLNLGNQQVFAGAIEAFVGLLVEVSLIVVFAQRFLKK
jgi:uncharacterized protein YjbI with pentapeptide repeats